MSSILTVHDKRFDWRILDLAARSKGLLVSVLAFGFLILFSTEAVLAKQSQAIAPIFPKALEPGDTVEIVAPAKYLDKDRVSLVKNRLEEMGFKVRIPENLFRKKGFLGGSDEDRAAELMAAFAD